MSETSDLHGTAARGDGQDADGRAFIAVVGERIRLARRRKGISRRALSELSDVSQRYLAQLEAGDGNVSIALLHRIAGALAIGMEELVQQPDPRKDEAGRFMALFRGAPAEQRRQVIQILSTCAPAKVRRKRICLLGLRGAGKSTLGKLAAEALSSRFVELNSDIEAQSGMAVDEVMALYGQEGYRRLERQALEQVIASQDAVVLAAAGGIVSEPDTFELLLRNFYTIWLRAAPADHMRRVRAQGDERPMAGNPKAMDELNAILASREALYSRADTRVDTSGRTVEESLQDLLAAIGMVNHA